MACGEEAEKEGEKGKQTLMKGGF